MTLKNLLKKSITIMSRVWTARAEKKVTHTRQADSKNVDIVGCKSVFERHSMFRKPNRGASSNSNSACSFQMDGKKRIAYICNSNKMRSILLRNVFVLCTYLIYPSVEKYQVFCEMGIAIAVTLIETIIDQMASSSKHIEPFAVR